MNLLHDPWIPTTVGEKGLIETLTQARQLDLTGDSFVVAAIVRLLLAVCHESELTTLMLLSRHKWNDSLKHLDQYVDRFDLRDGFLTCSDLIGDATHINAILNRVPARHNRVLEKHARDDLPNLVPESEIARQVLRHNLAALEFGKSATGPRHHSPFGTAVLGLAIGKNLLETLALNLIPNAASPNAFWKRRPMLMQDFLYQSQTKPGDDAARFSWQAQTIRFAGDEVITARGFKLSPVEDSMATFANSGGKAFPVKLKPSTWLSACQHCGWQSTAARTLKYAASTGLLYRIRVMAQQNAPKKPAKLLEVRVGEFPPESLRFDLAERLAALIRWFEDKMGVDELAVIMSNLDDSFQQSVPPNEQQLRTILAESLEDVGKFSLFKNAVKQLLVQV
jgi:hypothetical protein